jgi:predicted RNA-binding Zn ribbon-like protein
VGQPFIWVGNDAGLDLVNTVAVAGRGQLFDRLTTGTDLVDWALRAGLIDARQARACIEEGDRGGRAALAWAKRLRAGLRGVVDPVAGRHGAAAELDAAMAAVPVRLGYTEGRAGRLRPAAETGPLDELRLALAVAALDTTALERDRIRRCEGPTCVLLYYDATKNRSRRWCAMAACGNRAKAAAHYRRTRATASH